MNIISLLSLKWKSLIRHPLLEQTILFGLLMGAFFILLLAGIYSSGISLIHLEENIILLIIFPLLVLDFLLKFFFKKPNIQLNTYQRFPGGKKSITIYRFVKEFLSLWNYYLLLFFLPYLISTIYPNHGGWIVIAYVIALYALQLLISGLVNRIRNNQVRTSYKPILLFNILSENITANYLLLNLYMMIRSPRLRQQFVTCILLTAGYLYIISNHGIDSFLIKVFFTSIIFLLFPITFSQFIFSAEAAFFDRLIIFPRFKQILTAKYILFFSASFISFLVLLSLFQMEWKLILELTAIFLYCAGTITVLSFCCILFVNNKIDLFGSHLKMISNPPSVQSLVVLLIYLLLIALVLLVNWLFSDQAAVYFMLITGILSILMSRFWFNYLSRCFNAHKYEKLELFRIQ